MLFDTRRDGDDFMGREMFESLEPRVVLSVTPSHPDNSVVELQTNIGSIYIELYDTATPVTAQNFINYVNTDRYDQTFFHRSVPGFVIQGGGYFLDETLTAQAVESDDPIVNEYSPDRSNLEMTVAMAKLGGDPNSATNEFFFNLADNSSNLDNQNGGFTVFGMVIGGWDVVLAAEQLPIVNFGGAFSDVPTQPTFDPQNDTEVNYEDLFTLEDARLVHTGIAATVRADDGAIISAAAAPDGQLTATYVNQDGYGTVLQSGSWFAQSLGLQTGGVAPTGDVVTWIDPKDARNYAAAPTSEGVMLFRQGDDGTWTARNLTSEIPGSENIPSSLTAFVSIDGVAYITGIAADGAIVSYVQDGGQNGSGEYTYRYENISDVYLTPNGMTTPAFVGALTSYVPSWNALNIVGLDASGQIHTVWTAPTLGGWRTDNLSEITGAPTITGPLNVYLTTWDGINLAGTDEKGALLVTWWVPDFGGDWMVSDLTDLFAGPLLQQGSISSYVTPWGGLNVAGLDESGNVVTYWWAPGLEDWNVTNLNEVVPNPTTPTGRLTGIASPTGEIVLFGIEEADGKIFRYFWDLNTLVWSSENISDQAVLI